MDKNAWVNYTDSYNEIITRKFIALLKMKKPNIHWQELKEPNGEDIDYGVLLDKNKKVSKKFPRIFDGFRLLHNRRIQTPISHAYDKKTMQPTNIVTNTEQRNLFGKLKMAYEELIKDLKGFL